MVGQAISAGSKVLGRPCTIDDIKLVDKRNRIIHLLASMWVTCDARHASSSGLAIYAGPFNDPTYTGCPACNSRQQSSSGDHS